MSELPKEYHGYLSREEMQEILSRLRYKPGTRMWMRDDHRHYQTYPVLAIEVEAEDSYNPGRQIKAVHQTSVPPIITSQHHFVAFVRQCLERMEVHEMQEWLKWKDSEVPIFDPHANDVEKPRPV